MSCCVLCDAEGKQKSASIPEGWHYPICAEHRAQSYWRSRQPPAPRVITLAPPASIEEALERGGIAVPSLASLGTAC